MLRNPYRTGPRKLSVRFTGPKGSGKGSAGRVDGAMSAVRSFITRRPGLAGLILAVGAVVLAFGIYWFGPQDLVVDERVSESIPTGAPVGDGETDQRSGVVELARGEFRGIAHGASGIALLLEIDDGSRVLRFQDLDVLNGPDLKVYLSAAPASGDEDAFDDDYVSLGPLKGNVGDQNYPLPDDIDLARYRSAVIWCERFSVGFAVAPVESG